MDKDTEANGAIERHIFDNIAEGDVVLFPGKLAKRFRNCPHMALRRTHECADERFASELIVLSKDAEKLELTTVPIVTVGSSNSDFWTMFDRGEWKKGAERPTEEEWASEANMLVPVTPNTTVKRGNYSQPNFVVQYDAKCGSQRLEPTDVKRWACVSHTFTFRPKAEMTSVIEGLRIDEASVKELLRRARENQANFKPESPSHTQSQGSENAGQGLGNGPKRGTKKGRGGSSGSTSISARRRTATTSTQTQRRNLGRPNWREHAQANTETGKTSTSTGSGRK